MHFRTHFNGSIHRAERLHNDMFYFLGDAATAYNKHFQVLSLLYVCQRRSNKGIKKEDFDQQAELNKLGEGASLGPTVVVFQVRKAHEK